jgi:hypothetical protein
MSFRGEVIAWARAVLIRPALGSDPAELNQLIEDAKRSWDGAFGAEHAPIAPLSWEERVLLSGDGNPSERVAFKFPQAMEIVGMFAFVETVTNGNLVVPTTTSIDVYLDINNQNNLTQLDGVTTSAPGATRGGNFVTLAGLHVNAPRLMGLKLWGPAPEFGATFKYKQGTPQSHFYEDAMVGIQLYVRELDDGNKYRGANVADQMRGGFR